MDVYVRVSSVEQGSGYGPKEQLALAREVIDEAGGQLGEVYEDHISGRSIQNRSAMQLLLARKRSGDRRPVLVPRIDRLARNERDFHNAVDELVDLDVTLHFAEDEITTSQTDDEWRSKIGAEVAQAATFSRKLSGRVRRANKIKRREANGIAGGRPPFGYRWTGEPRTWEAVATWDPIQYPEEFGPYGKGGPIGCRIAAFELYATGAYSVERLVNELNRLGYRISMSRRERPRLLRINTVAQILRNPVVIGTVGHQEWREINGRRTAIGEQEVYKNALPPVIDQSIWDAVRSVAAAQSKKHPGRRTGYKSKQVFVFRNVTYCAACGSPLWRHFSSWQRRTDGTLGETAWLRHPRSVENRTSCGSRRVRESVIADAVEPLFEALRYLPNEVVARAQRFVDAIGKIDRGTETKRAKLEKRLRNVKQGFYDLGDISPDEYVRRSAAIKAELDALATPAPLVDLSALLPTVKDAAATWSAARASARQALVEALIERIELQFTATPKGKRSSTSPTVTKIVLTEPFRALVLAALARASSDPSWKYQDVAVATNRYFQELRRIVVGFKAYATWLNEEGCADAA